MMLTQSSKPQYDRLWQLRELQVENTLGVRATLGRNAVQTVLSEETTLIVPINYSYNRGNVLRDLLPTSVVSRYLLRLRLFNLFSDEGFSGWQSYPVQVAGKEGEQIDGYAGLQIMGKSVKPDLSRSICIPNMRGKLVYTKGLFFQNDEWDGSDFFCAGRRICVTNRVREALQRIGVDNIKFTQLNEVRIISMPVR